MIILSFYQWGVGIEETRVVRVSVVDSFEFCSIYFLKFPKHISHEASNSRRFKVLCILYQVSP